MKKDKKFALQLFAADENIITTSDLEPAISVDFTSRISKNITELQTLLGITDLTPMTAGNTIRVYKTTVTNDPAQVAEGETIPLTNVARKLAATYELTLSKYRKETTAEAIQRSGREVAVNTTDEKLVRKVQKDIKKMLYDTLNTGTGKVSGTNLQKTLAALWAALQNKYEDEDVSPVFFINPTDVADYLGTAQITMQTAFGFTFIQNFLGLGTAIISPQVKVKKPVATVTQNINGAYIPASGDVGQTFSLISDATGLIGMTHYVGGDNGVVKTLIMSGVKFYVEYADGIFIGTINEETSGGATSDTTDKTTGA
ncbi:MAG: hypothetical protein PHS82_06225 [Lachnospiraceae bacterium]|nr:hypothetical protein [Lachnospiraceae bacterium]